MKPSWLALDCRHYTQRHATWWLMNYVAIFYKNNTKLLSTLSWACGSTLQIAFQRPDHHAHGINSVGFSPEPGLTSCPPRTKVTAVGQFPVTLTLIHVLLSMLTTVHPDNCSNTNATEANADSDANFWLTDCPVSCKSSSSSRTKTRLSAPVELWGCNLASRNRHGRCVSHCFYVAFRTSIAVRQPESGATESETCSACQSLGFQVDTLRLQR